MRWAAVLFKILGIACAAGAVVLLLVVADWPRVAYGQFVSPHGPYDSLPSGCAACHVAHAGQGPRLLQRSEITAMCFVCHDGTGSSYDVASSFSSTSGNSDFHPVKSTGNLAVGQVLECVDCHNPHAGHPRLLQSTDGTNDYTEGPNFCLACHGDVDRNFTGPGDQYWENTLGSHANANSPAHYNTANSYLLPASGTKVTCVLCHKQHAASLDRLLVAAEESLCQSCHANGKGHGISKFNKTGSVHNVDGAGGSKLECSSCHGPHTVNSVATVGCSQCHSRGTPSSGDLKPYSLQGATSVLSDPDNTKALFAGQAGTGLGGIAHSVGDLSDFCLKCHDGSPPVATSTVNVFVPFTIVFPNLGFTTNSGGWNKAGYKDSSAHGKASITCGECHESHGSDYPALQRYPEDTDTISGECLRCHADAGPGPDIRTFLTKPYSHPTLTVSGYVYHSNTESYANMPLASRHAECVDCHDPHQAEKDDGSIAAPGARKPIAGVSGVSINFGNSSWSNWPTGATFSLKLGIDYQYELCFKCHSYYSYGTNPPASPSGGFPETDQAKEFNQNNPAYHAVVGTSKMPAGYGKFVSPWTYDSRMYCTDCHSGGDSGSAGPHGSSNGFVLVAPWNPDTGQANATGKRGSDTSTHLCFKCHDYNFYAGGGTGATSKFSNGGKGNLHAESGHRAGCAACHGAVPHGYFRRGLLVTTGDGAPYNVGVKITSISMAQVGAWRKGSCATVSGCH